MEALRERFGKYHVLDKIAQGGMAEVYKVKTVGIAGFWDPAIRLTRYTVEKYGDGHPAH